MRAGLFVIGLLLASPAAADDLTIPTTAFVVTAGMDWTTTAVALKRGAVERNPTLRPLANHPIALIAVGASADVLSAYAVHRFLAPRHPRMAALAFYAASAVRVGIVSHNLHTIHQQH